MKLHVLSLKLRANGAIKGSTPTEIIIMKNAYTAIAHLSPCIEAAEWLGGKYHKNYGGRARWGARNSGGAEVHFPSKINYLE